MATPISVRRSVRDEAAATDQSTRLVDGIDVKCGNVVSKVL